MTITLSEQELLLLTGLLGQVSGRAAWSGDDLGLVTAVHLVNAINQGNPKWRPYRLAVELEAANSRLSAMLR